MRRLATTVSQPAAAKQLEPDLGTGAVKGMGTHLVREMATLLGAGMGMGTIKDVEAEVVEGKGGNRNLAASAAMFEPFFD
jgi:hypothetical protein